MNRAAADHRTVADALHDAAARSDDPMLRDELLALAAYREKLAAAKDGSQRVDH